MRLNFYNKHFKKKLFNKIFFIYSAVIILSLLALSTILSKNLTQTIMQKDLNFNRQVLEKISLYFNQKYNSSLNLLQQFYGNKAALSDLTSYLSNDFNDYITNRLDIYSNIKSDTMVRFQSYIETCFSSDHDINSIILYSRKQKTFSTISAKSRMPLFNPNDMLLNLLEQISSKRYQAYTCLLSSNVLTPEIRDSYSTITGINNSDTLENCGAFIINYDINGIYRAYSNYAKDVKGNILILNSSGMVLFDSSKKYYGIVYPYFNRLKESDAPVMLDARAYVNLVRSPDSGAVIAGIIPETQIASGASSTQKTILLITFLLILAGLLLSYLVIVTFSRRTNAIIQGMEALKSGDFHARIPIGKGDDELKEIAVNFNHMCDSIDDYIQKVYMSEIKQKHAELAALQNQINPHFLYNTLEAIRMKAVMEGAPNIGNMVYLLASIFRNVVKSETFVTIAEELEQCKLYLKLFKVRYEDTFTYEIDVDDRILNYSIIKFTLQPVIENYIAHGIKRDSADNTIMISGYMRDGDIHFIISDNGTGIEKERLSYLQDMLLSGVRQEPAKSIGLPNVNERLKIIYGSRYGLEIRSMEGMGTSVEIHIPAKKKEDMTDYAQSVSGR